jgi:hypothetical protein
MVDVVTRRRPEPELNVKFYRGAWRWFCRTKVERGGLLNLQLLPHAHSGPAGCWDAAEAHTAALAHYRTEHLEPDLQYAPSLRELQLAHLRRTRPRHHRPPDPTHGDDQT